MAEKNRNIGGSLLPSGGPEVYKPMTFGKMTLVVVPSVELDTHFLTIHHKYDLGNGQLGDGVSILAQHANGHSCKALADRMIKGDPEEVEKQRSYIEQCGGMVRPRRVFDFYLDESKQ